MCLADMMRAREQVLTMQVDSALCKAKKLEEENAKLRELLQRTWDAFHDATAREFVEVKNELRELGIEVEP